MKARSILIIEDEHALGTALSFLVRRMGHLPVLAASGAAGLAALRGSDHAAVVLDIGLPDMSGLKVLEKLRDAGSSLPVLVITAHATLDHAIDAQKHGATAYLNKPLDLPHFEQTLRSLLTAEVDLTNIAGAAMETRATTMIGAAPCLRETFIGIARACAGDFPVLITGPGGSGKSLAASLIHAHGRQAMEPVEVLSCAEADESAVFDSSRTGTLVLDGVTDLSLPMQQRLAASLGGAGAGRRRILATTALEPREAIGGGLLREDLYYALGTLTISLPSLRERSGDIPALAAFFAGTCGARDAMPCLTTPVLAALQAYSWPGNVRELRHVIQYALTMASGGPVFLSHLPGHVAAAADGINAPASAELEIAVARWLDAELALPEDHLPDYDSLLDRIERVMLEKLLAKHGGRPTHMAAALRMHRATLRQKLRRAGLQRDDE
jgi:DNA-binding NtrC family response regulator